MKPFNPIVVVDVDGCLAEFIGGFTTLANSIFSSIPITPSIGQSKWDTFPGMSTVQIDNVWRYIDYHPNFWLGLEPLATSDDFKRLNSIEHVYYVTARPTAGARGATIQWLWQHGIETPTVVVSKYKGDIAAAVKATHAVDDKAGNAIYTSYASNAWSYIIDRPYNQFDANMIGSNVIRIKMFREFLDAVEMSR